MSQETAVARRPFPQVGEIFELTASTRITGLGLIVEFGYIPSMWQFDGEDIPAGATKRFKLVEGLYSPDIFAVAQYSKDYQGGKDTNGCWIKVFNDTFGNNGVDRIGVPDASWRHPDGPVFPMVEADGRKDFREADRTRLGLFLWLVEVKE